MTIKREFTTIKEAAAEKHTYKALADIKSSASTLDGINKAIERTFGDSNLCFDDEAALNRSMHDGFISFHKDGFILWIDGE